MKNNSLERFTEFASARWGPLTSELVASIRDGVQELLETPATEDWLSELHEAAAESRELYRDPKHGFVLLAHTESAGLYRPPHDHGTGWVVYAVQRGETEMGTYARLHDAPGEVHLVKRGSSVIRPGQVQVYLPGDIHDTRCAAGPLLLYRFTSCDLKKENVTRYAQRNGVWTDGASCTISK
jgi:predicted metal-dependent enzyme (double-stranded beta helix superfamily)